MCVQLTVQQQCNGTAEKNKAKKQGQGDLNSRTAGNKKEAKKHKRGFELKLCLSRIERSSAEANVAITCRLREGNFEKSSLAEFGRDASYFAGGREGCCVGGTWRGRVRSRGTQWRSELAAVFWGHRYIMTGMFS